jgi:hypothetical protein
LVAIFAQSGFPWSITLFAWIRVTGFAMTIPTLDGCLWRITPITLDHVILCAFKIEKYPLFELIIVFIDRYFLFSFQQLGFFFFCRGFHVTYVIFGHKHFTSITVFVSTHVRLTPSVFVHRDRALAATIVCPTG